MRQLRIWTGKNTGVNEHFHSIFKLLGYNIFNSSGKRCANYLNINLATKEVVFDSSSKRVCMDMTNSEDVLIDLTHVFSLKVDSLDHPIIEQYDGSFKVGCQTIEEEDVYKIINFLKGE